MGEQRPEPLVREALDLFGEYQHTSDQPSLVRAVHVFRAALAAAVRVGVPDIAAYHNNLGYALRELAVATGDAAVQAESVRCLRAAVAATDSDDPDRVAYLCSLASGLRELYGYTGDAELLRTAVQVATVATESAGFEPSPVTKYAVLAGALGDLYEHKADPAVLTELIAAYREAASCAELGDPRHPRLAPRSGHRPGPSRPRPRREPGRRERLASDLVVPGRRVRVPAAARRLPGRGRLLLRHHGPRPPLRTLAAVAGGRRREAVASPWGARSLAEL